MSDLLHHFSLELSAFSPNSSLLEALSLSEALPLTYKYRDDKRGDRSAPLEAELTPHLDIPTVARQITFVDVETVGNGRRFRMRPPEGMTATKGIGDYIDERLSGEFLNRTRRACKSVCDSGVPQFVVIDPTTDFPYYYCRLCVPASRDGSEIDVQLHAVDLLGPYGRQASTDFR